MTETSSPQANVKPEPTQAVAQQPHGLPLVGDDIVIDLTYDPPLIQLGHSVLPLHAHPPTRAQRLIVRSFDIAASLILIVALLPMFIATWLAVRLTSPGPALYRSRRVGQSGEPFDALKFRSMCIDADDRLQHLLTTDPEARDEYLANHKLKNDPRISPIGSFIRKSSIDELPQLFNVLRGNMSLVGPRPKLLTEPARFGAAMPTVLRVKPGLTGLWQVSGRSNLTFDERIILDVDYALHRTLRSDLVICCKTVWQALRPGKHGAY